MNGRTILVSLLTVAISTFVPTVAEHDKAASAQPRGGPSRVRIIDNAYRPRTMTVARGTVVRWVNLGNNDHTITANTDRWGSGALAPGEAFHRPFRRTGTYRYHCTIHPSMRGRIVVERRMG